MMKGKYITVLLVTALLVSNTVFTSGCRKEVVKSKDVTNSDPKVLSELKDDGKEIEKEKGEVSVTKCSDNMGMKIFQEEAAAKRSKNVIISPISLFTALDILTNGADGETKKQMKDVMGINSYTDDSLNSEMKKLINGYKADDNNRRPGFINIYNSLWLDKKFQVKDSFIEKSKGFYNSEIYKQDMSDKNAITNMNKWISEKTGGLIKNPISQLQKNTVMTVFNVLHFKGKWTNPFDKSKTQVDNFKLSSGESVKVKMMNGQRFLNYYEDGKVRAGVFEYYNGKMIVLLPKGDIDNFIASLSTADVQKYEKKAEMYITKVKLPVFNVEYKDDLNGVLMKMGMTLPFDAAKANFNNLQNSKNPLWIDKVIHDCVVSVDEEGTEAAALTAEMLCGSSKPPEEVKEFYVNKPFVFMIQDNINNSILFVGKVEKP